MGGGIALVAAGASLIGGIKQAKAQRKAGDAAQEAANINAALQRAQADQEEFEARERIRRMRAEGQRFLGTQRAQLAAAGVVTSEGSPLDIIGETAGRLALEQAEAGRVAGARKARSYAEAEETERTGRLQRKGARAAATGTLLSTAGGVAGQAINFGQAGIPAFKWAVPAS